jgi:hypothetical protein
MQMMLAQCSSSSNRPQISNKQLQVAAAAACSSLWAHSRSLLPVHLQQQQQQQGLLLLPLLLLLLRRRRLRCLPVLLLLLAS